MSVVNEEKDVGYLLWDKRSKTLKDFRPHYYFPITAILFFVLSIKFFQKPLVYFQYIQILAKWLVIHCMEPVLSIGRGFTQ